MTGAGPAKLASWGPRGGHSHSAHPLPCSHWVGLDFPAPIWEGQAEIWVRRLVPGIGPDPELCLTSPGFRHGALYTENTLPSRALPSHLLDED